MDKIILEYQNGKSLREIEGMTGIDHTTLYRKLHKAGVIRQRSKNLPITDILKLYDQKLSCREIARQLGITHPTVGKIIRKHRPASKTLLDDMYQWIKQYANFSPLHLGLYCKDKDYYLYLVEFHNIPHKYYCRDLLDQGQVIIIFEDEWRLRREQTQDFILAKLGIYTDRIYARKCKFSMVDKKEAVNFICNNHIQKTNNPGIVNFGLYYEDKLVGLSQLRKHHRNSKDITISRMCFLRGIQIIGGFSRLVKHATEWCFNNGYDKVLTWSDNRITSGDSYLTAGFQKVDELKSDYSYFHPDKPGERFSKQSMKKSNINCPVDKTEREWTEHLGYRRVWDCGKTKFEYYKPAS